MRLLFPFVLTLLLAAFAACGGSDGSDTLTVYSGRSEELIGPLLDEFEAETDIDVEVRYGDTAEIVLLAKEEGENTPADVVLTQSPTPLTELDSEGLLASLPGDLVDVVPAQFRDSSDANWVGVTGRGRVLVVNTDAVSESELPASVTELTESKYAGRVGVAPENGSFQEFVAVAATELGAEATSDWLKGMAANGSPGYPKNSAIVDAVARGEVDMGLVNGYYIERALAEAPDLPITAHAFPGDDVGSLVLPSAAAVTSTGDLAGGTALIEFLLKPSSQEYFETENQEYPLVGPDAIALDDVFPFPETTTDLGEVIDLISESGLGS